MARNDTNIQFLFKSLTGAAIQRFKPFDFPGLDFEGNPQQELPTKAGRSELGLPVYGEFVIQAGSYEDPDGNTIVFDGMEIDTVIVVVNQTKNIVKTQISGRNGTIKEYINDGDYEIQIAGILSSGINNVEPTAQIDDLVDICQARASLKVYNNYLDRLGITEMVIESYSFPQKEGFRDNFFFTINAVSNKPFELRIKEDI
jgi:hypothetical protein